MAGFDLQWTSSVVYDTDFRNVTEAQKWIKERLLAIVDRTTFKDHGATILKKRVEGYMNRAISIVLKPRACTTKDHTQLLPSQ